MKKLLRNLLFSLAIFSALFVRVEVSQGSYSFSITRYFQLGSWTPTLGTAAGSLGSQSIIFAKYAKVGQVCLVSIYFSGSQTTSASNYLTYTVPRTPADVSSVGQFAAGFGQDGGTSFATAHEFPDNSATALVYKHDFTQWATSGTDSVWGNVWYWCQ